MKNRVNVFLSFCFSSSKHNIIILLKYTCVEFISIKRPWKNQIKNRKNTIIQVARALVAVRKKEKISESKTTTVTYFDNLKKKQQDQGGKNWYYTENFVTHNLKSQN